MCSKSVSRACTRTRAASSCPIAWRLLGSYRWFSWPQERCAPGADAVAHLIRQRLGPDPKPPGSIQHSPTPCALVDEPVRAARIGQPVERWQRHLYVPGQVHRVSADTMRVNTSTVEVLCITTPSLHHAGKCWMGVSDVA